MDSILTEKLKNTSIKIINKLDNLHKNIPVSTYNIITYSVFNAFVVLSLLCAFVLLFYPFIYTFGKGNKNLK